MLSVCTASQVSMALNDTLGLYWSLLQEVSTKDQCQTCKSEVNLRETRFRTIISEMTSGLLASCTDNQCRSQVQSAQQQTLGQVDQIDSQGLCRNLGYCTMEVTLDASPMQLRLRNLLQHQMKTLDQRLESSNLCSQFGQMKPMCEHLMASPLSQRYTNVYLALLKNNPKLVDDDLRAHLATKPTVDICTACKNAVQSSKDFWTNSLVRHSPQNTMVMMSFVCCCRKSLATRCSRRVSDAQRKTSAAPSTTNATTTSRRT